VESLFASSLQIVCKENNNNIMQAEIDGVMMMPGKYRILIRRELGSIAWAHKRLALRMAVTMKCGS